MRNLLVALNNHPITKQRPDESRAAQRGWETAVPSIRSQPSSPEIVVEDVFRRAQTQRRDGQRRVGGRAGWERATAHQIEILMVVRALELVHHGLSGIIPHSAGPHDVAGADVVQANRLTVDFLLEPSRIVGIDPREFGKAHSFEQ